MSPAIAPQPESLPAAQALDRTVNGRWSTLAVSAACTVAAPPTARYLPQRLPAGMLVLRSAYASAHTCATPHRARLLGSSLRWAESLVSNPSSLVFSPILRSTSTSFLNQLATVLLLCRSPRPSLSSPDPGVVPIPVCPGSSRPYIQFTPPSSLRPDLFASSLLHTLLSPTHRSRAASTSAPALLSHIRPVSSEGAVKPRIQLVD